MLTDADLAELELDGDVAEFHGMVKKLRDHYASRHINPREAFTIGVAQANDGRPTGVAVVGTPARRSTTSRCGCSAGSPTRCPGCWTPGCRKPSTVLAAAGKLTPTELSALPLVHLSTRRADRRSGQHQQVLVAVAARPAERPGVLLGEQRQQVAVQLRGALRVETRPGGDDRGEVLAVVGGTARPAAR